jgi:membrane protein implicated in regulation of membrane protease activity
VVSAVLQVALGLALPWFYTGIEWLIARAFPGRWWSRWIGLGGALTAAAISSVIVLSAGRLWYGAGTAGVTAVAAAVIWWHRRKKRRRAAALLGAKSRALRDALVRRARQSARPRPVLRPVPGGAR